MLARQHHQGDDAGYASSISRGLGREREEVSLSPGMSHVLNRPIVDLMGTSETPSEPSELELDDVVITNPHIEAILENEDWVEDAS